VKPLPAQNLADVSPGDWFVVDSASALSAGIYRAEHLMEIVTHGRVLASRDGREWAHAGVASRRDGGQLLCVEAEPNGAIERPWKWENDPHLWSTGLGLSVPGMGEAARRYTQPGPWGNHGVPYGYLTYVALIAHGLRIPAPHLRAYIETSKSMMCSQLVDQVAQDKGVHLFDDRRWCGYVTPLDLGLLLEQRLGLA